MTNLKLASIITFIFTLIATIVFFGIVLITNFENNLIGIYFFISFASFILSIPFVLSQEKK